MPNNKKEIERKFLVDKTPNLEGFKKAHISQGYIQVEPTEIRIRMMDDECFLTAKGNGDLSRIENETEISLDAFGILYSMVLGRMVEKVRYFIPLSSRYTAEFDVYQGYLNGLKTIEVEFKTEEEAKSFVPPVWFGEEITNNKNYKNKFLATSVRSLDDLKSSDVKNKTLGNIKKG